MKKIILLILCTVCCVCGVLFCVASSNAEVTPVLFTVDNVVGTVGNALTTYSDNTNAIVVVLATNDNNGGWNYQDNFTFDSSIENLTKSEIEALFASKPIPTGVDVEINIVDPDESDVDFDYDSTGLQIKFSNTISSSFDPTNYKDNRIEMTIPAKYINNSNVDMSLDINGLSTGSYKIDYQKYTVSYDVHGHGVAPKDEEVIAKNKATKPSDPSESNYTFDGWYTDTSYTTMFDFENTAITSDITLHAKWTYNAPAVIVYDDPVVEVSYELAK